MNHSKRDEIAARAYRIWVEEGRPPGKAQEHWLRAEQEVAGQTQRQEEAEGHAQAGAPDGPPLDTRAVPDLKAAPPLGDAGSGAADTGDAGSGDAGSGDAPASPRPKRKTTRSGRSRMPPQGPRTPQQG